jgi:hypothetical protein
MKSRLIVLGSIAVLLGVACTSSPRVGSKSSAPTSGGVTSQPTAVESGYHPSIDPADFAAEVDNTYFPLAPGTTYVYEGVRDGESQRDEVVVTNETKVILGVTCVVVRDTATHGGTLIEKTDDWYVQDKAGNVWYFGEATAEYNDEGKIASTEGSWEAGVAGAQPGIIMPAHPQVPATFRQEFYQGHAEDMFWIVSSSEAVKVRQGSFVGVLQTIEWTPLEPKVIDKKYYASGIGLFLEVAAAGGDERAELVRGVMP